MVYPPSIRVKRFVRVTHAPDFGVSDGADGNRPVSRPWPLTGRFTLFKRESAGSPYGRKPGSMVLSRIGLSIGSTREGGVMGVGVTGLGLTFPPVPEPPEPEPPTRPPP